MHAVHLPFDDNKHNKFFGTAMGLIFDTKNYNADMTDAEIQVIDTFFDSIDFASSDAAGTHVSDLIAFGNLMNLVDMKNRWMYAGGLTTPPCTTKVLFNICRTVYPIK